MASRRQRDLAAERIRERNADRALRALEAALARYESQQNLPLPAETIEKEYRRTRVGYRHDARTAVKGLAVKAPRKLTRVGGPFLKDHEKTTDPTRYRASKTGPEQREHPGRAARKTTRKGGSRPDGRKLAPTTAGTNGCPLCGRPYEGIKPCACHPGRDGYAIPPARDAKHATMIGHALDRKEHDARPPKNDSVLFGTPRPTADPYRVLTRWASKVNGGRVYPMSPLR